MLHRIRTIFTGIIILGIGFGFLNSCDSGDKVINEATGNRALKQYDVAKDKLKAIDEQQKERNQAIPGDESRDGK